MTFQPGAAVYTQAFGSRPEDVEVPHIDVRAPSSTDILYPIGKRWINRGVAEYVLLSVSSVAGITSANWSLLGTVSGSLVVSNGNLTLGTAGNKINIATGTNASIGTSAAMTAGTITISTTAVTANSKIFLTVNTVGGTQGTLSAPTGSIVAGTSFVINSSSNTDTSTVNWWIIN